MKLGSRFYLVVIFMISTINVLKAEEKITSTPLINLEKIKPSFEELVEENENIISDQYFKKKKK